MVGAGAATLLDLLVDRAAHHVARSEVLDRGGVALHEPLAVLVEHDAAFAARGLGQEHPELGEAGRMELEHLHVLERHAAPPGHRGTVAGQGMGVRGDAEHAPVAAGGHHDALGTEHVELTGGELVRHDPGGGAVGVPQQVEAVELVEEANVAFHALLIERLQDHVAGAVGGIACALHGPLTVVRGMAAEPPLVDPAFGCAVERQSPAFELVDRLDGLFGHQLRGGLIGEVVAALDGVERVPLGAVLLDVAQGGAHPALRGTGVRAGGVELGDDGGADLVAEFDRGAHPGAAGAHDQRVVGVRGDHQAPDPHFVGSNVTTMTVPRINSVNPST